MVTVLLAIGSAACYGVSNFVGPLLARRETLFVVMFVSQTAALLGALVFLAVDGGAALSGDRLGYAALAGLGNAVGLIGFYKAAALGPLSVVAPIGATGAIVPVVYGLATGDALSAAQAVGLVLALGGCVLASRRAAGAQQTYRDPRASALWAAASAFAFGVFLTALPQASDAGGRAWAIVDARLVLLVVVVVWAGRELRGLRVTRTTPLLTVPGLLLLSGTLFYVIAAGRGQLSLVSVLGALFPVFTVGLSVGVLGERPSRVQSAGVASALAGVVLIAA